MSDRTSSNATLNIDTLIGALFNISSGEELFQNVCHLACEVAEAVGVAILARNSQGSVSVLSSAPKVISDEKPEWLASLAKTYGQTLATNTQTIALNSEQADAYAMYVPLFSRGSSVICLSAYIIGGRKIRLQNVLDMLQLVRVSLLLIDKMSQNWQIPSEEEKSDDTSLLPVLDIVSEIQNSTRFNEAATNLCASLASVFKCRRVAIGQVAKHNVKIVAIDQMENFSRGTRSIRQMEEVMQEAFDQGNIVLYDHLENELEKNESIVLEKNKAEQFNGNNISDGFILRAARDLAMLVNVRYILSIPLKNLKRDQKQQQFVMLFQIDRELSQQELHAISLICKLVAPRLQDLYVAEEFFIKKIWRSLLMRTADIFGPKRTVLKLVGFILITLLLVGVFVQGKLLISAPVVVEGVHSYTQTSPIDSYLFEVNVRPGDEIKKGDILGTLDSTEINLEIATLEAQVKIYENQASKLLQEGKDAEAAISRHEVAKAMAQVAWAKQRLSMTELKSKVNGFLVSEDLYPRLGQPVSRGQELFEITDTLSLRAIMHVPELNINDILESMKKGQVQGEFTLTAYPDIHIPFIVERIHPYATITEESNGFEVRGKITEIPKELTLRPGMEGFAKISVGKRAWIVILTRDIINKIRLLWWKWM